MHAMDIGKTGTVQPPNHLAHRICTHLRSDLRTRARHPTPGTITLAPTHYSYDSEA